jgi:hypothetical protein
VSALEQVLGGEPAAGDVVDRDRALVGARRLPVDEDHRHAALAQRRERGGEDGGRRDQHALHTLLGEHVEVRRLLGLPVVGVAEDHGEAGRVGRLLDAAGDVGEERVGDVEHDQADGPAHPGAQLAGRLVAHEAEGHDRVEHPAAGLLADGLGAVEHVADRAHRDPGVAGDVADAGGQRVLLKSWGGRGTAAGETSRRSC